MSDHPDPLDEMRALLGAHADDGLDPAVQNAIQTRLDARVAQFSAGPRRSRWAWARGHLLLVSIASLVAAGGVATAATLVLGGQQSPPTSGPLPPHAHQPAGTRYRIRMVPQTQVGTIGWCSTLQVQRIHSRRWFGGAGCGPASRGRGIIAGATTYFGKGHGLLAYSIVDDSVAYALTTQQPVKRLLPVSDPHLPNGWRAIVQLPGDSHTGNLRFRTAAGKPVSTRITDPRHATIAPLPTRAALGAIPTDAPCTVELPGDAKARGSRWITTLTPATGLPAPALLPCAQTRFQWRGGWAEATVLLDAASPGTATPLNLGQLGTPNSRVAGATELQLVVTPPNPFETGLRLPQGVPLTAGTTARQQGVAWLAVRATSPLLRDQLVRVLRAQIATEAP